MSTLKYWIWLATRAGLGTLTSVRLLERFGTPENAYFADQNEYEAVEGLSAVGRESLWNKELSGAEEILGRCDRLGLRLLTLKDAEYPSRLKNIPDPPILLYLKGRLPVVDEELVIGMVGSRTPSAYGVRVAREMSLDLARAGVVLCSGIAAGVDAAVLRGGLAAGGTVISVVAGGLDIVTPAENRGLYEDVAATGVLVSEYPPGTPHLGGHYRSRNRIISGLSEGVVVVEGNWKSGSLITAHAALEQGREVFAVPGNVDSPMSAAPNQLLYRQEAGVARNANDVLEAFLRRYPLRVKAPPLGDEERRQRLEGLASEEEQPLKGEEPPKRPPEDRNAVPKSTLTEKRRQMSVEEQSALTDDQKTLLRAAEETALRPDELIERTDIPANRVLSALTLLQVRGYMKEETGNRFVSLVRLE